MTCMLSVGMVKDYTIQITTLLDKKPPNLFKIILQKYVLNHLTFFKDIF